MLTLGIDLAAQPDRTGLCLVEWQAGTAEVRSVVCGADDPRIIEAIEGADRVGIDVPFGWPEEFVEFVVASRRSGDLPLADVDHLRYRETDRVVRAVTGRRPLSVSSDLIAVPAFRAMRILAALAARGHAVDRSGAGEVVEAYPAAALRQWGFTASGYKGAKGRELRVDLVQALRTRAHAWLKLDDRGHALCCRTDNALDALVAALVARAAACALCEPIPPECHARALVEGWIALPLRNSFDRLAAAAD